MNDPSPTPLEESLLQYFFAQDFSALSAALQADRSFISRLRRRVRSKLEMREMLHPDQTFYVMDAEQGALEFIIERTLCHWSLQKTLTSRGAVIDGGEAKAGGGGTFDPSRGSIVNWVLRAADFQLCDWIKNKRKSVQRTRMVSAEAVVASLPSRDLALEDDNAQAERLRATQKLLALQFRRLSPTRRACLIVKFLSSADEDVLADEDLDCLWRVREEQAQERTMLTEAERQRLRQELTRLVEIEPAAPIPKRESAPIAPLQSTHPVNPYDEIEYRFQKTRRLRELLDYYQQELQRNGWSDEDLRLLAERSRQSTLDQIAQRYSREWTAARRFEEYSQRHHRASAQLAKLRAEMKSKSDLLTPSTGQIAEFLRKTPNAVSTALSKALDEIGRSLMFDYPEKSA